MISSPHAYLSPDHMGVELQVSNYNFCIWILAIGLPRDSHVSYAHFNGFLLYISYSYARCYSLFHSKVAVKRLNFEILLLLRLISIWTSCRTIQGVIVLVISNRPRATRLSEFEITCAITPCTPLGPITNI